MKVFVVFALFVVAAYADLCSHAGADLSKGGHYKSLIVTGANTIFGHCYSLDFNTLLFGADSSCLPLFEQGLCYGQLAAAHYEGHSVVGWGLLAQDVPNIQEMADHSCAHVRGCYNAVKAAFMGCKDQPGFVDTAIEQAEKLYIEHGDSIVAGLDDDKTLLGELVGLLRNRFQSVSDIRKAVEDYISDEIITDAEAAADRFDAAAVQWCNSNCHHQSGPFLQGLFNRMEGGRCRDAAKFCGQCESRADAHLESHAIPCCLDNVIQQAMDAVDYVQANYDDLISDLKNYLTGQLSNRAVKKATAIKDRVLAELDCLGTSYDLAHNDCA